jgi:hypothetical protein
MNRQAFRDFESLGEVFIIEAILPGTKFEECNNSFPATILGNSLLNLNTLGGCKFLFLTFWKWVVGCEMQWG